MAGLDFTVYIVERTRDFTGREWVFEEIDRWLADDATGLSGDDLVDGIALGAAGRGHQPSGA